MLPYFVRKLYNSALYQGSSTGQAGNRGYFEGWYFKMVTASGRGFAVIPGVSLSAGGGRKAFIQTIDGETHNTGFTSYDFGAFAHDKRTFDIHIENNRFSSAGIELDLMSDSRVVKGTVAFDEFRDIPRTLFKPGIMGWYRYVPFMECYHGIISIDHGLSGALRVGDETIDFSGGRGYIEKDWGASFPSSWIWMQSNHFGDEADASFMMSIARIPWRRSSFIGHIAFLSFGDAFRLFATYSGGKIDRLGIGESDVIAHITDARGALRITAVKGEPGGLKAPVQGVMDRLISESVSSSFDVELTDSSNRILFRGTGRYGGMEVAGEYGELQNAQA